MGQKTKRKSLCVCVYYKCECVCKREKLKVNLLKVQKGVRHRGHVLEREDHTRSCMRRFEKEVRLGKGRTDVRRSEHGRSTHRFSRVIYSTASPARGGGKVSHDMLGCFTYTYHTTLVPAL
jgi:hypothetical protein